MSLLYHIVHKLSDCGPLICLSPSVCRPYQRHQQAKCVAWCSALPFPFVFDFARSPTDAKLPDAAVLRALPVRASRYALRCESTTAGHCVGLHALQDVMHCLTVCLCGLLGLSSRSRNMVTACNNSRVACCSCSSSDWIKLLLGSTPYCVIASNTSPLLDLLQALASAQLITLSC